MCLLFKCGIHLVIWFTNHRAQGASEKVLLGVGAPSTRHRGCRSAHRRFNLFLLYFVGQVLSKDNLDGFVHEIDVAEAKLERQVVVKLDHVSNSQPDCAKGVINHVLAHLAGSSDRNRVSVYHAESLLVD